MATHATRSDQARLRLREEMERKKLSQREVADLLTWSQSRVAKLLTGRVEMGVNDLEALCFAIGLSMTEVVRDHGLEFVADMTPTELRLLERMRQLRPDELDALMTVLQLHARTRRETKGVTKSKSGLQRRRA